MTIQEVFNILNNINNPDVYHKVLDVLESNNFGNFVGLRIFKRGDSYENMKDIMSVSGFMRISLESDSIQLNLYKKLESKDIGNYPVNKENILMGYNMLAEFVMNPEKFNYLDGAEDMNLI